MVGGAGNADHGSWPKLWLVPWGRCPPMAHSRHAQCADKCPLLGANRTFDQPLLTNLDLWVHGLADAWWSRLRSAAALSTGARRFREFANAWPHAPVRIKARGFAARKPRASARRLFDEAVARAEAAINARIDVLVYEPSGRAARSKMPSLASSATVLSVTHKRRARLPVVPVTSSSLMGWSLHHAANTSSERPPRPNYFPRFFRISKVISCVAVACVCRRK